MNSTESTEALGESLIGTIKLSKDELTPARIFAVVLSTVIATIDSMQSENVVVPEGILAMKSGLEGARLYLGSVEDWNPGNIA